MYTAKVLKKEKDNGILKIFVIFSNGTDSQTEWCIPQDKAGFKHWVKSRLTTFNGASEIDADYAVDAEVDVSEPVIVPVVQTAEEIAQEKWLRQYTKWVKIKSTLIDTGILTGNETKLVALKTKVQDDYLPAYLDII